MKRVRAKLNSKNGASLSVALLFFLIMAMIGSSILAAAGSSNGSLRNVWQNDQQQNVVNSAAKLVISRLSEYDELLGKDHQFTSTSTWTTGGTPTYPAKPSVSDFKKPDNGSKLENLRVDMAIRIITNGDVWAKETGQDTEWSEYSVPQDRSWGENKLDLNNATLPQELKNKHTYILSVSGKDKDKDKACVDLYMDEGLNMEIHVYPYEIKNGQIVPFDDQANRVMILIPAGNPQIQFNQTKERVENSDPAIYTVTRTVTLSNFGWGKPKVYMGADIAAQGFTKRDHMYLEAE